MKTHMALEDYLEAMLMVQEQYGVIRSIDVAQILNVTKPSVTYNTKRLRDSGFITMDDNFYISLTDKGLEIATKIYNRHKKLTELFIALGVSPATARADACRVEHDLSEETFEAISRYTVEK